MFYNPIIPGFSSDPSFCRKGDDYYLVTSTFEYFPSVALYHSKDLTNWTFVKYIIDRDEQLDLTQVQSSQGIFAANIRYNNGLFYMITTCMGGCGHFYMTATDPTGDWSNPIYVEGIGFDDDIFFDTDGKTYFVRQDNQQGGIILFELERESGKLLTEGVFIHRGFEDQFCEGPHLYHIGDYYYLMQAENGTYDGHMETISRSKSVWGPYENCPFNPILTHRNRINSPIQATGHADLIQTPKGHWYLTFLGTRPNKRFHILGRETFLAPVQFTDDKWFVVNEGKEITLEMNDDFLPTNHFESTVQEDFSNGLKCKEFCLRRNQEKGTVVVDKEKGLLTLTKYNNREPFVMFGIRQRAFQFTASTHALISNSPLTSSGLMVIMNECHYYALGIEKDATDKHFVVLKKVVDDMVSEKKKEIIPQKNYHLSIQGNKDMYSFFLDDKLIGSGVTSLLSSEVALGFTGVFISLFIMGANKTSSNFEDFQYYE